jgi:hypothetical protein
MNNWDEDNLKFVIAILGLVAVWMLFYIFLAPSTARAADNSISIDQIGSYNTVVIAQDGTAHDATVTLGKSGGVDNTAVTITQQGTGAKSAAVELTNGINNSVTMFQDGTGNHTAAIQNLNGSANNISITQNGAGNHSMTVAGGQGTTNNANTITTEQTGGSGADKTFQLNLNGTTGATVNVQQTNPTQSNTGNMNIQCSSGCGTWNYIRQ